MRYKMLIEYNGEDFHGWQIQPGVPTVQECIEQALETALRHACSLTGSGRTDAGVHARGQVAHFDSEAEVNLFRLKASLNGLLPKSIGILSLAETHKAFHARYDAIQRHYHYYITTEKRPLSIHKRTIIRSEPDFERMNAAAESLLGSYNYSAFCKIKSETKNRVCNVLYAQWIKETYQGDWYFKIVADRFLHGMVRAITGTLLEVGRGKRPAESIKHLLASEDRTLAGPAAPAHGLVLEKVSYSDST
ncbi:MAG: tRNA pseudouridine(38-40) synthase TruA [Rhodothermales bacterium]